MTEGKGPDLAAIQSDAIRLANEYADRMRGLVETAAADRGENDYRTTRRKVLDTLDPVILEVAELRAAFEMAMKLLARHE